MIGHHIKVVVTRRCPFNGIGNISRLIYDYMIVFFPDGTRNLLKPSDLHGIKKPWQCLFSFSVNTKIRTEEAKATCGMYVETGAAQYDRGVAIAANCFDDVEMVTEEKDRVAHVLIINVADG